MKVNNVPKRLHFKKSALIAATIIAFAFSIRIVSGIVAGNSLHGSESDVTDQRELKTVAIWYSAVFVLLLMCGWSITHPNKKWVHLAVSAGIMAGVAAEITTAWVFIDSKTTIPEIAAILVSVFTIPAITVMTLGLVLLDAIEFLRGAGGGGPRP